MYLAMFLICAVFIGFGIFFIFSKKQKLAGGVVCIAIGICIFISIPIIAVHSFLFSEKTESKTETQDVDLKWHLDYSENLVGKIENDILLDVLSSFSKTFVLLEKYPNCIESANVIIRKYREDLYLYRQEEYGWTTELDVEIKIKDNMNIKVGKYLLDGQTLHYFIGGGIHPGVEILKSESAIFIGIEEDKIKDGINLFIPVPEYEIIDNLIKE